MPEGAKLAVMSSVTVIAVYREGNKLILVDGNQQEHEAKTPQELWDDLMGITADPSLPRTETGPGEAVGPDQDQIIADTADRVGEAMTERYGLLAGHLGAETLRRVAPSIVRNYKRRAARRGKKSG